MLAIRTCHFRRSKYASHSDSPATSLEGRRATFENPALTFPRRIIYERLDGKTWSAKGYGAEYDIVLRKSGRRFAWDGNAFALVKPGSGKIDAKVAKRRSALRKKLFKERKAGAAVSEAMNDIQSLRRTKRDERGGRFTAIMLDR